MRIPNSKELGNLLKCSDKLFIDFLEKCFCWDPTKRLKPLDALMH